MKIIYNDWLKEGLDDFLQEQPGIKDVNVNKLGEMDTVNVTICDETTSEIVAKFIDLFQENKWANMFSFDKETGDKIKTLNYYHEEMCCEYCHMHLIRELFANENVLAVDSNFDLNKKNADITYVIKYKESYTEKELLDYINNILK